MIKSRNVLEATAIQLIQKWSDLDDTNSYLYVSLVLNEVGGHHNYYDDEKTI